MRVLITGGSGFIGLSLKERLGEEHDVLAPSSKELDLVDEGSVSAFFQERNFDAVIHCATWDAKWNSGKDFSLVLDHNLRMFFNLAREGKHFGRLISLGSGAEFSRPYWLPFATEDYFGTHVPCDPYGFSKYLINKYIEHMPDAVNLRLFGVFGPHEDWRTRFISNAICRAIYGLPITIIQDALFDYLYIEDLLDIMGWFLKNGWKEKAYNICTGRTYRLSDLAKMILEALQKDLPVEVLRKGYGVEYSGDNSRLLTEMPGLEFTPMEGSIRALARWYQEHLDQVPYEEIRENKRVALAQQDYRNTDVK